MQDISTEVDAPVVQAVGESVTQEPPQRVRWGLVALFYAIAFGLAALISVIAARMGGNVFVNPAVQWLIAFLYMPAPLIAGLVVEAVAKRGFLVSKVFVQFKPRIVRVVLVGLGWWAFLMIGVIGVGFLLGNVARIPGMGVLPTDQASFLAGLKLLLPAGYELTPDMLAQMPPWWIIYVQVAVAGIVAGFTINALFAFGEEYGWRGVLQDLLAPLGEFKANVLIGLMWGVWHAPIIVMIGYNYPGQPLLGSITMTLVLVPFAFVEYQSRRLTGSLLGPAVVHGMYNASAGIFLFAVGRNALLGFPLGAAAFVMFAIAAWAMAVLPIKPLPLPGSAGVYPQDRVVP
ncbi:MAG: CPBP family intramembrane metalloprotease [Coriobacteriia bacterium]|nr:CPBP family intramembrane metalloprotease [Coriobacteriia bacterium]